MYYEDVFRKLLEEANRFIQKFINENQLARWKKVLGR
jgi:hypothetical protein